MCATWPRPLQGAIDCANARIRDAEAVIRRRNGRLGEANDRIDEFESAIVRHIVAAPGVVGNTAAA